MMSINLLLANEIEDNLPYNVLFFATCIYLQGNLRVRLGTQSKSLRKFNLRSLRLLDGPFGQGLKQKLFRIPTGGSLTSYWLFKKRGGVEFEATKHNPYPSSGREEDLNSGPQDYKSNAFNQWTTLLRIKNKIYSHQKLMLNAIPLSLPRLVHQFQFHEL